MLLDCLRLQLERTQETEYPDELVLIPKQKTMEESIFIQPQDQLETDSWDIISFMLKRQREEINNG